MAKKKTLSYNNIISLYMNFVLENNEPPKSVYSFVKLNNFDESFFYKHFSSFKVLEKNIFKAFHDNTITTLNKNKDYSNFIPRHQLLSYYFTLFENFTANRSYVVYAINDSKKNLNTLSLLSGFKLSFSNYIKQLNIDLIDTKQEKIGKIQNRGLIESAWAQLILTLKFWIDDESPNFEKTDIYIEKSINTCFDLLDFTPLKNLVDLGKFIYKEKFHKN